MKLVDNWENLLRKAWSLRLMAISAIFAALEGLIQALMFFGQLPSWMPPGVFLGLSLLNTGGAFVLRLVKQKGVSDGA